MKIIIQSFGDIITNSSTETFCISNGSTSDLQLLIDTILKVYGINNSSIIVKEIVDYDSLSDLSSGQIETLAEIVYENSGIDSNIFLEYARLGKWNLLENMLSNVGSSLLEIAKIYNDTVQYGLIFTRYTIETTIPNTDALKEQIENLSDLFTIEILYDDSSDLMVTPKQDTTECIEAAVILSSLRSLFNYEVYEDR